MDQDLVMPGAYPVDATAYPPGMWINVEDLGELDTMTTASEDNTSDDALQLPHHLHPDVDYMRRLERVQSDHLLGVIHHVLQVLDELWCAGLTEVVVGISQYFHAVDEVPEWTAAQSMAVTVLRRLTSHFRVQAGPGFLSPYYKAWSARALSMLLEETGTWGPASGSTDEAPEASGTTTNRSPGRATHSEYDPGLDAAVEDVQVRDPLEEDHAWLMQLGGRRQTAVDRALRPRRPREWMEAMRSLEGLPCDVAARVRSLLRAWLNARLNRVASVNVVLAMMLRDVAQGGLLGDLAPDLERTAQNNFVTIRRDIEAYLDRNHQHDHFPHQAGLVQEALRQAVHINETDFESMPAEVDLVARDMEEIHLMFHANGVVRRLLLNNPGQRRQRLRMLMQALRQQLGGEARHLRRMSICLHGLQMIGDGQEVAAEPAMAEDWVQETLDELVLLAGSETPGISTEQSWTEEFLRLRRWMAEDRLHPL